MTSLAIAFWFCVLGVITPYTLYPLGLFLLSRLRPRKECAGELADITFVISAFNEADVIREKIENTLDIDYPPDSLQTVVISDESDDGTDTIVSEYAGRVLLLRQTPRQGKSAGINHFADQFTGQLVVFSDANSMYQPDALRMLVRHFDDASVGYVVGRQKYEEGGGSAQESENVYWNYELLLKEWESRVGSVVGGDGAIMAIRRELFTPLRADDINDFVIPLRIVSAGYRGVFEPAAICTEEAAPSFGGEFRRKVRIVNRSFRAVLRNRSALNPFRVGIFAAQLFCHKVVRWFAGFFMAGALISNIAIVAMQGSELYRVTLLSQIVFYAAASLAVIPPLRKTRIVSLCYYFCLSNVAAAIGIVKVLLGGNYVTWTPQRGPAAQDTGETS